MDGSEVNVHHNNISLVNAVLSWKRLGVPGECCSFGWQLCGSVAGVVGEAGGNAVGVDVKWMLLSWMCGWETQGPWQRRGCGRKVH